MTYTVTEIQGALHIGFHSVPDNVSLRTIQPEQATTMRFLAAIDFKRFPDFVLDILTLVEGHRPLDVTDGPGDEGQDILTLTPNGERHLTQCKHTEGNAKRPPGEVDDLFMACLRKNCKAGLLVTNADLSIQAKSYVLDGEYQRGGQPGLPRVDYWNANAIWRRISKNSAILNKWFSQMGQVHALRSFHFDLVVHRMPQGTCDGHEIESAIANGDDDRLGQTEHGAVFRASKWFTSPATMGMAYVDPRGDDLPVTAPLLAFRIEVNVPPGEERFRPEAIQAEVVRDLSRSLPALSGPEWWSLVATPPRGLVFIHDCGTPCELVLSSGQAFVAAQDDFDTEEAWAFQVPSDGFVASEEESEMEWVHTASGTKISLYRNESLDPVEAHMHAVLQRHKIRTLASVPMWQLRKAHDADVQRARRLTTPEWTLLLSSDRELFLSPPPASDIRVDFKEFQKLLPGLRRVHDQEKEKILAFAARSAGDYSGRITSDRSPHRPTDLHERILWLQREIGLTPPPDKALSAELVFQLIDFKIRYELEQGYNLLGDKSRGTIRGEEVKGLLFDIQSFRGKKMIDMGISDGWSSLQLVFRWRVDSPERTETLLHAALAEFDSIALRLSASINPGT